MKTKTNKAISIYLALVLGVCYLAGVLEAVSGSGKFYQFLGIGFTLSRSSPR